MKKMSSKISLSSRSCREDRLGPKGERRVFWKDWGATKLPRDEGLIRYLSGLDTGLIMSNSSIKESSNLTMKKNITQWKCHRIVLYTKAELDKCDINKSMTIYIALGMLYILRFPYIKTTLLQLNIWQSSQALKHVALGCIRRTNQLVLS